MGGITRAAPCQYLDDIKVGKGDDRRKQHGDGDDVSKHWYRNIDQSLPGVGPINGRRLIEISRYGFQRGQIHDQKKGGSKPDVYQNHAKPCPAGMAQSGDRRAEKRLEYPVDRTVVGIENPPPAQGAQGGWHDPGNQGQTAPDALPLGRDSIDQMRHNKAEQGLEEYRCKGKQDGLAHDHPEGIAFEQEEIICQSHEGCFLLVQQAQPDRIKKWIDDQTENECQQR